MLHTVNGHFRDRNLTNQLTGKNTTYTLSLTSLTASGQSCGEGSVREIGTNTMLLVSTSLHSRRTPIRSAVFEPRMRVTDRQTDHSSPYLMHLMRSSNNVHFTTKNHFDITNSTGGKRTQRSYKYSSCYDRNLRKSDK